MSLKLLVLGGYAQGGQQGYAGQGVAQGGGGKFKHMICKGLDQQKV